MESWVQFFMENRNGEREAFKQSLGKKNRRNRVIFKLIAWIIK